MRRRTLLDLSVEECYQPRGEPLQVFCRGLALRRAQGRAHRLLIVKIHFRDQVVWRLARTRHAGDAAEFHPAQAGPLADERDVSIPIVAGRTPTAGKVFFYSEEDRHRGGRPPQSEEGLVNSKE